MPYVYLLVDAFFFTRSPVCVFVCVCMCCTCCTCWSSPVWDLLLFGARGFQLLVHSRDDKRQLRRPVVCRPDLDGYLFIISGGRSIQILYLSKSDFCLKQERILI